MSNVSIGINIHAAPVRASIMGTAGHPLTLSFGGSYGSPDVTMFCQDRALATALAAAINGVLERHRAGATSSISGEAA